MTADEKKAYDVQYSHEHYIWFRKPKLDNTKKKKTKNTKIKYVLVNDAK